MSSKEKIYKVIFANQDRIFEVYARKVNSSNLFGFIEIEELIFGKQSTVLVDTAEEKLRAEFSGVKRSYIPMQSVVRIDEVEKEGTCKITDGSAPGSNIMNFPSDLHPSTDKKPD